MSTSGEISENTIGPGEKVVIDVLIVDDSPSDIEIARRYLERDGAGQFRVRVCNTLRDGKQELKSRLPDCMLLDLNLPDGEATQWLAQLREEYEELPFAVVALTGNSYSKMTVAFMQAGASDYLVKGRIDSESLRHTILKAVDSVRLKAALRVAEASLRKRDERLRMALKAGGGFHFEWNPQTDEVTRSEEFGPLMGMSDPSVTRDTGTNFFQRVHPEDIESMKAAIASLTPETDSYRLEYRLIRPDGDIVWLDERARASFDASGRMISLSGIDTDISARVEARKNIEELNVRLHRAVAESNHRVKNNLQVLSALVELETSRGEGTLSNESVKRISLHVRSLAKLHDLLTWEAQRNRSHEGQIPIQKALKEVLQASEVSLGKKIHFHSDEVYMGAKMATSFLMAANEMLSNASKHGRGQIELVFTVEKREGGSVKGKLVVSDDGPGFPVNFDPKKAANTGLELIESLGRWDLEGTVEYCTREGGGGSVVLEFSLPAWDRR